MRYQSLFPTILCFSLGGIMGGPWLEQPNSCWVLQAALRASHLLLNYS